MDNDLRQNAEKYHKRYRQKRIWHRLVSILGCCVVFCTTYALILPAITQERATFCGKEPHIHDVNCYVQIAGNQQNESMEIATDSNVVRTLVCILPEIIEHKHDESCYEQRGHTHDETCYVSQKSGLICPIETHVHGEDCYGEEELSCIKEEHHVHDSSCYSEPELICSCTGTDSNAHGESCYSESVLICEEEEAHIHEDSCYDRSLVCSAINEENESEIESEYEGHVHDESCYEYVQELVCNLSEDVEEQILVCEESETQVHTHSDACYEITGQEIVMNEPPSDEPSLTCEKEEDGTHTHSELCYGEWELICDKEEHTHELICYSDPSADVETESVWEKTFEDVELTGIWAEDILAIAKTQLGYHESTKNYMVAPDGETKGYTRYGAWYGDHYGDWCAMFVSFCLHYAEVDVFGLEANCQNWIDALADEGVGLYREAGIYTCRPGDLVFFDFDEDGESDHIGIVAETNVISANNTDTASESDADLASASNVDGIKTIEGNSANRVRYVTYASDDPAIMGFGELPGIVMMRVQRMHVHGASCYAEDGAFICGFGTETNLIDEEYFLVEQAIRMIETIPTADEIDEKIMEFEDAEDYEGEELWLTEIYQEVARAYKRYSQLSPELQEYVWNRDKLLELDYIWSMAKLVDIELAQTIAYHSGIFTSDALFVVYVQDGSQYYAFDGFGNAVPITIDADGTISANVIDRNELLWQFTSQGNNAYLIKNAYSGRYMHAFPQSGSSVTSSGAYNSTLVQAGEGVKVRSNSSYAYLDAASGVFRETQDSNRAAVYKFGVVYRYDTYVWLDGTNGGLMSLMGSPNIGYPIEDGQVFTLPSSWQSPEKYNYVLRGWYDVKNGRYYAPGSEVTVTEDLVFYADWVAKTYDVGQFNAQVTNTVSTNSFITTHVFDYNTMFNMYSQKANVSADGLGHSESWSLLGNGEVSSAGSESINFIFTDYDMNGMPISYPGNRNAANTNGDVYSGLYNDDLAKLLFGTDNIFNPATGEGVLGKQYVGQADHLFQYGSDPSDENYGYYYYDSRLNAASYNQSAQRFYVYDYLERTTDSEKDGGLGEYSDFLPFNSPYANTNGKSVETYTYNGENNEYAGVDHCMYDAKYNSGGSSENHVATNYWFGMSTDIEFYLPNKPGTKDSDGNNGNQSIYGDDLVFEFSGDDDVWVLVDGKLVLDIGGIHGVESGSINFSTGDVEVNGSIVNNVRDMESGSHTLTIYYLERGSSQSNCKIRFNITPRYMLTLQKEDVLTRELLNGAEFSVYTDLDCTEPAELWTSRDAYMSGAESTHVFKVQDGTATIWGFSAGNTYYIKETLSPYGDSVLTNGIIVMTLNNLGMSSYKVIQDPNSGELSGGFTVHGVKVDYENQEAFLVATNGENITEVTSVQVQKKWNDTADHSATPITVYLLANGNRIREVTLDSNNDWQYIWENLPKYMEDGVTEVVYTVQEGTVPGYLGKIERITEDITTTAIWTAVSGFSDGGIYLLKTDSGYLAAGDSGFYWETDETTAKTSEQARWITTVNGNYVSFINEDGKQIFYDSNCFQASPRPGSNTQFRFRDQDIVYGDGTYAGPLTNNVLFTAWSYDSRLNFTLLKENLEITNNPIRDITYQITNTPVSEDETVSLTVKKAWDLGALGMESMYKELTVKIKLLENGVDTGLTLNLNLKNGWTDSFTWLPKYDETGNEIVYTVEEVPIDGPWSPEYGEIALTEGSDNRYEVTVTNVCNLTYQLPETGGPGVWMYITGVVLITITSAILLLYKKTSCDREEGRTSR